MSDADVGDQNRVPQQRQGGLAFLPDWVCKLRLPWEVSSVRWAAIAALVCVLCCLGAIAHIGLSLHRPDVDPHRLRAQQLLQLERASTLLMSDVIAPPSSSSPLLADWRNFAEAFRKLCDDRSAIGLTAACGVEKGLHERVDQAISEAAAGRAPLPAPLVAELRSIRDDLQKLTANAVAENERLMARLLREYSLTLLVLAICTVGFTASGVVLILPLTRMSLAYQTHWRTALQRGVELKASRDRLQEIIEAVPAGIAVYDSQERLLAFNAAARTTAPGLAAPDVIGKTHAELAERSARRLEAAGFGAQPFEHWIERFRNRRRDVQRQVDTGRWYEFMEKETPSGLIVGLRVDVTDTKRQELRLKGARHAAETVTARYQALVESLSDMVFAVGDDGRFSYVSPAADELLRAPRSAVLGSRLEDWLVPEERDLVLGQDGRLAEPQGSSHRSVRCRLRALDGSVRPVELRYSGSQSSRPEIGYVGVVRDVTELERARTEYETLVGSLADVAYRLDLESGTFTFVSAAAEQLLGRKPEEMVGTRFIDYLVADSPEEAIRHKTRPFDSNDPDTFARFRMLGPDGRPRSVEVRARRRLDESGRPISIGIIRDVSELERARSEYETLVASLTDVVYRVDVTTGKFTFVSAAAERLLGKRPEEIIGKPFVDYIAPDSIDHVVRKTSRPYHPDDLESSGSFRILGADGAPRHVEVKARRHLDEKGRVISAGVIRDVEDRIQLQRRLQAEMTRLTSIVDSVGALLVLIDGDLNVVMANREFGAMTGVDIGQVVGKPLPDLLGEQLPPHLTRRTQFALRVSGKDGQERLLSITATPARDRSGEISHVVLLGVDETERRRMEQALHDLERHATVGEMAGTMAHEISQPLQAIDLACASALTEIDEPVDEKGLAEFDYVRKKLALIEQQVRKASRIMGDLRSFVRGTVVSDSAPFDVNQTVRHAAILMDYALRQDGVTLTHRLADGLPPVVGQGVKLEQILINLFNNARDAGARAIEVVTESAILDGRAGVRVSVLDSGPGIPADVMAKLFHSFVTTKPQGKGTGLGLRICRGLVEEMDGTITVANREQGGAKFDVFLPLPADEHG